MFNYFYLLSMFFFFFLTFFLMVHLVKFELLSMSYTK